jgi:hypothetical protein
MRVGTELNSDSALAIAGNPSTMETENSPIAAIFIKTKPNRYLGTLIFFCAFIAVAIATTPEREWWE